jgi:hypothetical protein
VPPNRFLLLVYRAGGRATTHRVAIWRLLKKAGAVYLQQSVCVVPDRPVVRHALNPILERIRVSGGEYHLLPLRRLPAEEEDKIVGEFRAQTSKQYAEIIENCEVNFQKEIEFETFRQNFTYEEAEEIRIEYEKIVDWHRRVRERDWFEADRAADVDEWVRRCEHLLEAFEAQVYRVQHEAKGERLSKPEVRAIAAAAQEA